MTLWRVQRPAVVWIEATVEAESLWDALDLWEKKFANGETEEKNWEINFDKYWAEDETGLEYDTEGEGETLA